MQQFKLKVGRSFALISNHLGGFDLFVTGRRHFLLSERSRSFNNVIITLTSARSSARTVELASGSETNQALALFSSHVLEIVADPDCNGGSVVYSKKKFEFRFGKNIINV